MAEQEDEVLHLFVGHNEQRTGLAITQVSHFETVIVD